MPQATSPWAAVIVFIANFLINVGVAGAIYTWAFGSGFVGEMRGRLRNEEGKFSPLGLFSVIGKLLFEVWDLFVGTAMLAYELSFIGALGTAIGVFFRAVLYALPWGGPAVAAYFNWADPGGFPTLASLGVAVPAAAALLVWIVYKFIYLRITDQTMVEDLRRDVRRLVPIAILLLMYNQRLNILDLLNAFTLFYRGLHFPYL